MKQKHITKEEAIKSLPDYEIIHSFRSFIGADWDREAVVETINNAEKIAWIDDVLGHDLAVMEKSGKVVRFEVSNPHS